MRPSTPRRKNRPPGRSRRSRRPCANSKGGPMRCDAMNTAVVAVLAMIGAAGCSSMADAVGHRETQRVSPTALHASPELYQGRRVMLGGTIVAATRRPDGTDLEVRAHPLDRDGRPELNELTTGPFVVRSAPVL